MDFNLLLLVYLFAVLTLQPRATRTTHAAFFAALSSW